MPYIDTLIYNQLPDKTNNQPYQPFHHQKIIHTTGAVSSITAISSGNVKSTFFTSFSFEKVFGQAGSALAFYENREMIDYFKNLVVDAGAERGGGARKMPKSYMKRNSTVPMSIAMSPAVSG